MVKPRTPLVSVFILLTIAGHCSAEVGTTVELQLFNSLIMLNKEEIGFVGTGTGNLSFIAGGDNNVKGEFGLETIIAETPLIQLTSAFIKVRFPGFRTTVGKAPVSWAPGFAFNAGDIVFRAFSPSRGLIGDTLRDMTKLQTQFYLPLGPFSFLEILALPPEFDIAALAADPEYVAPSIRETEVGTRGYFDAGFMAFEPGYLYDAGGDIHYTYLGLQSALGAELYAAASLGIETKNPEGDRIYETFILSGGASYIATFRSGGSLTGRLEALVYPAGKWEEQNEPEAEPAEDPMAPSSPYPLYGLLLYPEVAVGISDSASVFLRSIFSPVDMSALTTLGGSWNIFGGFDLLCYLSVQGGDETDVFSYGNPGWFTVTLGAGYIF